MKPYDPIMKVYQKTGEPTEGIKKASKTYYFCHEADNQTLKTE